MFYFTNSVANQIKLLLAVSKYHMEVDAKTLFPAHVLLELVFRGIRF